MNTATDTLTLKLPVTSSQPAAMTAQLTTITPADAAGTPDYAIQAVINSSAYGFAAAGELITFIYVVRNLQVRVAELEAIIEGLRASASN
jgi:hypothetical protein